MAKNGGKISRRDFVSHATSVAALGGGLYFLGTNSEAQAAVEKGGLPGLAADSWLSAAPRRLSELTRRLAERALAGEHGRNLVYADFALAPGAVRGLTADMRYAHACRLVAEKAPLRILPGERIVGSATLREAANHNTPVAGVSSVSHTTIGYDRVLKLGYKGLRREVEARLARGGFETREELRSTVDGPFGKALETSGSAAYVAEALPDPVYETPPLTVECWARVENRQVFNVIAANRSKDSRRHWELYSYHGSGAFSVYMPGFAPAEIVSDRDIADGEWRHLAMTFDGRVVSLSIDGEEVKRQDVVPTGALGEGSGGLYIGGCAPAGIGCHGAVAAVRISRGVRTFEGASTPPATADAHVLGLWRAALDDGRPYFQDFAARANSTAPFPTQRGGADLLEAMLISLDAAEIWRKRYTAELERLAGEWSGANREICLAARRALERVPENPPENFHEAVQSLWFMYAFQRLMGNWTGIGRIDAMLGPYLEKDLAEGRLTLDDARELLAHFWIKGCEWIGAHDFAGSGDAQHYQNIVLSGVDAQGKDVTNPVTYLVLDVVEELHISDFPIAVRLNQRAPRKLLRRMAEVQRRGGGIVAMYNEQVAIDGLVAFGYPLEEARGFANDGCWETLIPGKTCFSYAPFDILAMLHETLGLTDPGAPPPDYPDFDSLYEAYLERVEAHTIAHNAMCENVWKSNHPAPLLSMFVEGCVEKGRGYYDRGPKYSVLAPHAGGMPDAADSLYALKKLVYEERFLSLAEFVEILRKNWEGNEALCKLVRKRLEFYGNDNDEADAMMVRLFNDYTGLVGRRRESGGVLTPCGISTFGRGIGWRAPHGPRKACPSGRRAEEILATNLSPSPGSDAMGPTAVLNSYCKMDFTRCCNGATVELKLHPASVKGDAGVNAMVALMRGFVRKGGMFMHINVVDSALLADAQRHPEKYPNLAVRIAGWSARFATMSKDWQDMVIQRTQQDA